MARQPRVPQHLDYGRSDTRGVYYERAVCESGIGDDLCYTIDNSGEGRADAHTFGVAKADKAAAVQFGYAGAEPKREYPLIGRPIATCGGMGLPSPSVIVYLKMASPAAAGVASVAERQIAPSSFPSPESENSTGAATWSAG